MILHVPHSSKVIPPDFQNQFLISLEDLSHELLCMTDAYTDELFALSEATMLVFPYSRLVCDVERFLSPMDESMMLKGMGMYYTHSHDLKPLKKSPFETIDGLFHYGMALRLYQKHHRKFSKLVQKELDSYGKCLILDIHSFSNHALPYEDSSSLRPALCLGTDKAFSYHYRGNHSEEFLDFVRLYFSTFSLKENLPFSGSIVPEPFYSTKDNRVCSIMLEINRSLYMDELTGEKLDDFPYLQAYFSSFVSRAVDMFYHS